MFEIVYRHSIAIKKNALGSVSIVYTASSTINKLKDKAVILLFFQHDLHLNAITRRHGLNVYTRAYVIVLGVRNSPRLGCKLNSNQRVYTHNAYFRYKPFISGRAMFTQASRICDQTFTTRAHAYQKRLYM